MEKSIPKNVREAIDMGYVIESLRPEKNYWEAPEATLEAFMNQPILEGKARRKGDLYFISGGNSYTKYHNAHRCWLTKDPSVAPVQTWDHAINMFLLGHTPIRMFNKTIYGYQFDERKPNPMRLDDRRIGLYKVDEKEGLVLVDRFPTVREAKEYVLTHIDVNRLL